MPKRRKPGRPKKNAKQRSGGNSRISMSDLPKPAIRSERTMIHGKRLRALRMNARMTISQLAGKSGVGYGTIRSIELGNRTRIADSTLFKLAKAFNEDPSKLRESLMGIESFDLPKVEEEEDTPIVAAMKEVEQAAEMVEKQKPQSVDDAIAKEIEKAEGQ